MTASPVTGSNAPRPTPPLRVLVGHVLRRHRLAQRRTLADVAGEARVSTQYLSELERGRKEASSEVLAALCRALRLDLTDLLSEVRDDVLVLRSSTTVQGSRIVGIDSHRPAHAVQRPTVQRPTVQPLLRAA